MARLERARAGWHRFERNDKPAFIRWRARAFGALLSRAREVEIQIRESQALVHEGIFHGVRGPRGGYELARERRRISIADILRAAGTVEDAEGDTPRSRILDEVVLPAIADAERAFTSALARLNLEDMTKRAESLRERG